MITFGQQNVVKFPHLISKEGKNNKCYVKHIFPKVVKNFIKLLTSPFWSCPDFLYLNSTQREIGPSKGALGHSGTHAHRNVGTQAIVGTLFSTLLNELHKFASLIELSSVISTDFILNNLLSTITLHSLFLFSQFLFIFST